MRYEIKAAGSPTMVITEADGKARIHIEGQSADTDLVMTSEQFDAFLGEVPKARSKQSSPAKLI